MSTEPPIPIDTRAQVHLVPPRTSGEYPDEATSLAALDAILERCGLFRVYAEVWGDLVQRRPGQEYKKLRIDRMLVPVSRLKAAGWRHGAIGIEGKRSDIKFGPALSQAMDYGRCLFELDGGVQVCPSWVFLWPLEKRHGPIASLMAQSRIGTAHTSEYFALQLHAGEGRVLQVGHDGSVDIGRGVTYGKRTGSR